MRTFIAVATAAACLTAVPALADNVTGEILAYDRLANVIVLTDNSVWEIVPKDLPLPADLKQGDRVTIDFVTNGDSGVGKINSISRVGG
ncbi:hypothetical protein [Mesorhizobium sp. 10J20-29]|jgi:hypothetical protein